MSHPCGTLRTMKTQTPKAAEAVERAVNPFDTFSLSAPSSAKIEVGARRRHALAPTVRNRYLCLMLRLSTLVLLIGLITTVSFAQTPTLSSTTHSAKSTLTEDEYRAELIARLSRPKSDSDTSACEIASI
jgi:hypothetical protein